MDNVNNGLEGVVVAETRLSDVNGAAGRLVIAGHDVEALAAEATFERVFAMLVHGEASREAEVRRALGAGREAAWQQVASLRDVLSATNGMDSLRAALARTTDARPESIAGATAVFVAAASRLRAQKEPIAPDASKGHAEDLLRMLGAAVGNARALDAYLVTVSDHGMNASTFTARVIASTGSDLVSAVVGALGALKGPLHGGAPGPVLDMLDAVEARGGAAKEWVNEQLLAKRRIMGMGHRVYRVRDPRAAVLEAQVRALAADVGSARLRLAREVERVAEEELARRHPDRALRANVEFYTAVLLEALGVPRDAFTPVFAVGRVAGWCAHFIEQQNTGRLIRPSSRYIGSAAV
jgi:citrate synthase